MYYDNGLCPAEYSAGQCGFSVSGSGSGSSQTRTQAAFALFDPLSAVIDDWDYANGNGTRFNVSISSELFNNFVSAGAATWEGPGLIRIGGGILIRVVAIGAGSVVLTGIAAGTVAYLGYQLYQSYQERQSQASQAADVRTAEAAYAEKCGKEFPRDLRGRRTTRLRPMRRTMTDN